MEQSSQMSKRRVMAIDLGDRTSVLAFRRSGKIVHETLNTGCHAFRERFSAEPRSEVFFEAGSQSHWVAWMLEDLGHVPVVVHPRSLPMNHKPTRKNDQVDADLLLECGELRPSFMTVVQLRPRALQLDMVCLRTREMLVRTRTELVSGVRSHAKLFGQPIPTSGTVAFPKRVAETLSRDLYQMLAPLVRQIEQLSAQIGKLDGKLKRMADRYPATALLRQVWGIGEQTALAFVLTLQGPERFKDARAAGAAVGLVPRQRQSGSSDPELSITKTGDTTLRWLLVLAAQRMLRKNAPDTDLKRFALRLAARGGKNSKKRAVVALARKLAVLLMALWRTGEAYEPLREAERQARWQAVKGSREAAGAARSRETAAVSV